MVDFQGPMSRRWGHAGGKRVSNFRVLGFDFFFFAFDFILLVPVVLRSVADTAEKVALWKNGSQRICRLLLTCCQNNGSKLKGL